jgi:hypothetical protein
MVGHRKVIASRHARPISPLPRCHSRFGFLAGLEHALPIRSEECTMKTEQLKMLAGELYDPMDPELVAARVNARDICQVPCLRSPDDCVPELLIQ